MTANRTAYRLRQQMAAAVILRWLNDEPFQPCRLRVRPDPAIRSALAGTDAKQDCLEASRYFSQAISDLPVMVQVALNTLDNPDRPILDLPVIPVTSL